jgi:hypothetical protein
MAQKIEVKFLDDIDGSEAIGTLEFTWEGTTIQVDLNQEHMEEYNHVFEYLKSIGRVVSKAKRAPYGSKKGQGSSDTGKIREWLRAKGHQISDRGRIPNRLMEEYHQGQNVAQESTQTPEPAKPADVQDPGVGTTTPKTTARKARATKPKPPQFKEALAEVLTLEPKTPAKSTRRRTSTAKKPTSTTK